jgi:hypothetical protein
MAVSGATITDERSDPRVIRHRGVGWQKDHATVECLADSCPDERIQ